MPRWEPSMPTDSGLVTPSDAPLFRWRMWIGILALAGAAVVDLLMPPAVGEGSALAFGVALAGWVLFVGYVTLRVWSILYLGGRKSRMLVTEGPYAMVQNPLYLGSFLFALSCAAFLQSVLVLVMALLAAFAYVLWVIPAERRALAARLGADYEAYAARTPALIPRGAPPPSPPTIVVYVRGIRAEARRLWVACLMPPAALLLAHVHHASWWPRLLPGF